MHTYIYIYIYNITSSIRGFDPWQGGTQIIIIITIITTITIMINTILTIIAIRT